MNPTATAIDTLGNTSVVKTPEHNLRIFPGSVPSPAGLPLEVLYEVPGLVAWVGKRNAAGQPIDIAPVFIARENQRELSATTAGIVLLTDLLRDIVPENRPNLANLALPTVDTLESHIDATYGAVTTEFVQFRLLHKPLGTDLGRFLAQRLLRTLKINYLAASKLVASDGSRLVLTRPHATIARVQINQRFTSLREFATHLGGLWLEAERQLLARHPELADRSRYFQSKAS